jgi:hypothetical protein
MVGIFVVAAGLMVVAVPAALALSPRAGILRDVDRAATDAATDRPTDREGPDDVQPTLAL